MVTLQGVVLILVGSSMMYAKPYGPYPPASNIPAATIQAPDPGILKNTEFFPEPNEKVITAVYPASIDENTLEQVHPYPAALPSQKLDLVPGIDDIPRESLSDLIPSQGDIEVKANPIPVAEVDLPAEDIEEISYTPVQDESGPNPSSEHNDSLPPIPISAVKLEAEPYEQENLGQVDDSSPIDSRLMVQSDSGPYPEAILKVKNLPEVSVPDPLPPIYFSMQKVETKSHLFTEPESINQAEPSEFSGPYPAATSVVKESPVISNPDPLSPNVVQENTYPSSELKKIGVSGTYPPATSTNQIQSDTSETASPDSASKLTVNEIPAIVVPDPLPPIFVQEKLDQPTELYNVQVNGIYPAATSIQEVQTDSSKPYHAAIFMKEEMPLEFVSNPLAPVPSPIVLAGEQQYTLPPSEKVEPSHISVLEPLPPHSLTIVEVESSVSQTESSEVYPESIPVVKEIAPISIPDLLPPLPVTNIETKTTYVSVLPIKEDHQPANVIPSELYPTAVSFLSPEVHVADPLPPLPIQTKVVPTGPYPPAL